MSFFKFYEGRYILNFEKKNLKGRHEKYIINRFYSTKDREFFLYRETRTHEFKLQT